MIIPARIREKVSGRQLTLASVGLLFLFSVGAMLLWSSQTSAHHSVMSPVAGALPLGYVGEFRTDTLTVTSPSPIYGIPVGAWSITAGALPPGLILSDGPTTGDGIASILGTPTAVNTNGNPYTFTVTVTDTGGIPLSVVYTMDILGQLIFSDTIRAGNATDRLADSGAQNAPIYQFGITARGEDMQLTGLIFQGIGTGLDTVDIERVELYTDSNSNGVVDAGDVLVGGPKTFAIDGNFNPKVTITPIGFVVLNGKTETFLVVYDFKNPIDPARTFRLALENSNSIGWTTLSSLKVSTAGGALYASGGTTYFPRFSGTNPISLQQLPRYSAVTTINGVAPGVPTLTIADYGFNGQAVPTSAGAIDTTAITMMCYASAGATMTVRQIKIDDFGSGIAAAHITAAKLYIDVDRNGKITSADSFIKTGSLSGDQYTFDGLSISVTTPTGLATDTSRINLIIGYTLRADVPVTAPPLTFQAQLINAARITAVDQFGASPVVTVTGGTLIGHTLSVSSASSATQLGPRPIAAVYTDGNLSTTVNSGDTLIVSFDTNLLGTSAATSANFSIPVIGDGLGVGATAAFFNGNKMVITLGTNPTLTVAGTYSGATLTAGAASGINLMDTSSGIRSLYNAVAEPALAVIDITSGAGAVSSSGSGAASLAGSGSSVCIVRRHSDLPMLFTLLRTVREKLLESSVGRAVTGAYYSL